MAETGGRVALSVTDNGAGMPMEEIPRVMQPFEQTELGKTKEGTGQGLPMVQRIAELHGGEFVLESALGEGTVATVMLPVDCTATGNKDAGGGPN